MQAAMKKHKDTVSLCVLCDCVLSEENDSEEHIILNAIGGRRKVTGFICKACNNRCGSGWDAALAKIMAPFCIMLNVKRERGETPHQTFVTIKGEPIRLNNDGSMTLGKASASKVEKDGQTYISVQARTLQEAKKLLQGFKRQHPDLDIDAIIKQTDIRQTYLNDPIKISFEFGGPNAGRSLVKSALALAVQNGVNPHSCRTALHYLKDQSATPCFGFYYEKDLILNRPKDRVFHCVAINGNPRTGLLLAYIEYFSAQRVVVCLSDSYSGPEVHDCYAIDPVAGLQIDVQFHIPFTKDDVAAIYRYEKIPDGAMESAMRAPMEMAIKLDFERSKDRAISHAVNYAFKHCGAAEGEILTDAHKHKISRLAAEQLMPFVMKHLKKRPNDTRQNLPFAPLGQQGSE
jgi:hypothetical protein